MKKNPGVFILILFFIIGIGLLIGSVFLMKDYQEFKETAVEVQATIEEIHVSRDSDGDTDYDVFVSYQYGGESFDNVPINFYSSSMYEGKEITLLCDPAAPGRVKESSAVSTPGLILVFMGVIFMLISGMPMLKMISKSSFKNKLMKTGRPIYATVVAISHNPLVTVNGQHPFTILCKYEDPGTGTKYMFESDNIWVDPSPIYPVDSTIQVMVDEKTYDNYYVNTEGLKLNSAS